MSSFAWLKRPHLPDSRSLSGIEFLWGAAIVIGHNVFRVVPNEVPILFVLGIVSLRIRSGDWAALGFRRPESWLWLLGIVLVAAVLRIVLSELVIQPLAAHFWPAEVAPHGAGQVVGNPLHALAALGLIWTFAAFGEEISYRGYLLTRAAEAFGRSSAAWWLGVVLVSILFGYGHYYKGPAGIVDSGVAGLILGSAYLLAGRNLWVCVLAHGLIDTFAVVSTYLGW